jgi:tight adherence protein B
MERLLDMTRFESGSLLYVGIFLGVLLAFEGLRQILTRSESQGEARNRRMRLIAAGASTEDLLRILKPTTERWQLASLPLIGGLPQDLRRAGLSITPSAFVTIILGAFVTVAVAGSVVAPPFAVLPVAALLCLVAPVVAVRMARRRRMDMLVTQLPDALELMSRGLKVGHPLSATIGSVATDMLDPVASEFGIMVDQVAFGEDLVDAFADFAERSGLEDVHYLAVSVAIQHGTGGNLAQVLMTLAKVVRDRLTMRRRIKAISAEGRLTSVFLSLLPFLILGATTLSSPGYYWDVADDPLFRPFAIVVGVLVLANMLIMRKLVDFRI